MVRPIFVDFGPGRETPSATPEELASAIIDCLRAGARLLNVSSALVEPAFSGDRRVQEALDRAAALGTVVVAAAGNQANIGRSAITGHPAVLPVVACD
ncbi:MAG: S8 family serine peptidase, partial [Actinobacteria bacterium]|nr:S8 family serine peptidase [Actinomycetota bacterium]